MSIVFASSVVTHNETDYTQGTDNNTISTDINVVLGLSSGTTLYNTGYYLSRIFDFGADTNIYSFFWKEDYNYGTPLPNNQSYDNDINMFGNILLYHLDSNIYSPNTVASCYAKDVYLNDGDMEKSGVSDWSNYLSPTKTKETIDPYQGSQVLRVACSATACGVTQNVILSPYKKYNLSGVVRSSGTLTPYISGAFSQFWTGTTSTNWQNIDVNFINYGTALYFYSNSGTGYLEWDNLKLREIGSNGCNFDYSGNDNNQTLDKYGLYLGSAYNNGADCKLGQCLNFDEFTDYVLGTNGSTFSFGNGSTDNNFSASGWVYFNDYTYSGIALTKNLIFNKLTEYAFYRNSSNKFGLSLYNAGSTTVSIGKETTSTFANNQWYHWAVTYDGSKTSAGIKIYINGIEQSTADNNVGTYVSMNNSASYYFNLGYSGYLIGTTLWASTNGKQDEFKLWKNIVLSATDINNIYQNENVGTHIDVNTSQLIADYNFNFDTSTTIYNGIGSYNGIVYNYDRPKSNSGRISNAYELDGLRSKIQLGRILGTDTNTSEFSFSGWVYPHNLTNGRRLFAKSNGVSNYAGDIIFNIATTNTLQLNIYNPSTVLETVTANNNALTTDAWQFVTVTYKNGNVKIYVNGQLNKDANMASTYINSDNRIWYLGEDGIISTNQPFDGLMDEVAFWNRELSQNEITNIYRRQASDMNLQFRTCNDSGCDGESFVGPDGAFNTYYQYGNTTYNMDLTSNRYFQYKTIFSTTDTNSLVTPSPKLYDVNFQYYNLIPQIDITDINGNSDSNTLPNFSHVRDSNSGILRIDFNVYDPNNNDLTIDLNYSVDSIFGTGTNIVESLDLNSDYCDDSDFSNVTHCFYDWNIYAVPDGNYYLIVNISDTYDTNYNISNNIFMIDNTSATITADYNTPAFDGNVILSCFDAYSGCDKYYYQTDSNAYDANNSSSWIEVNGDINTIISYYEDGNYQISYYSIDNVGNTENRTTIYFIVKSPALKIRTYNSDNNLQSYFGIDDSIKVIAEFESNTISEHKISFIDINGNETSNFTMTYFDNNNYYYDLILTNSLEYGWIDINVDGYVFQDVFYFSKTWQNNHLSLLGNIFPFKLDFNVTNNEYERYLSPISIDVNFDYRCALNSIRIIKCEDANCDNDVNNILELPSQVFDQNIVSGYVKNATIIFMDSFVENQTNYYYVVYSIRDINTNYYSDLSSVSDSNIIYFENSKYKVSLDLNSGALLSQMMQKSINDYNYNNTNPTVNILMQKGLYTYDRISEIQNVSSSLDINGVLLKKYLITGYSDVYDIPYSLDYTFFANKPYFRLDIIFDPDLSLSSVKYTDYYLEIEPNIFTKFSRFGDNTLIESTINKSGDGSNIIDVNINYFALSDVNRHLGIGTIFTTNPLEYDKSNFYDDSDYEWFSREFFSGDITSSNIFSSTYYFMFFDSFIGSRDINNTYYELMNPISYAVGTTTTFDSASPIISDFNYSPYNGITDQNTITVIADINDTLEIDTVTLTILGPDTNSLYSVVVNDMNYSLSYDFNVHAGDYNVIIYSNDIANNTSAVQYTEFNVADTTAPNIISVILTPDTNALIDPDTNVLFDVNIKEYTGISDIDSVRLYMEYYDINSNAESSSLNQMNCTEPDYLTSFDVNCSLLVLLDENEHIIKYQVYANDDLNNDSNTALTNIYDLWEYSWSPSNNFSNQVSGILDTNISVGDINVENIGDKNLTFKITSTWDTKTDVYYDSNSETYDGYIFSVNSGNTVEIPVVVNAKSSEMDISTTFIVSKYDSEYESRYTPDSNSISVIISSITSGPHAYLEFRDKDISLVQGNTNVLYSAYIKNDGNDSCLSAYASWTLPSGVSIASSIDRNDFVFDDGNSFIDSIYVDVSNSAELGEKIVSLTVGCRDNNYSRTISLDVVLSDIYGNTSGSARNNNSNSGGGGSSKKDPKYTENNLFNLEQKSKLFETNEKYQIVRGKDTSFVITITNPFDDININDISITTTGLFIKYLLVLPSTIKNIGPGKSEQVIISLTAPAYFDEGSNQLNFVISGKVSGNVIEKDSNTKYISFVENKNVLLKVFDIDPKDANTYLQNAEQIIDDLNSSGFYVGKLLTKLSLAELDFSNEKYSGVKQIVMDIEATKTTAEYVLQKISDLTNKLNDAKAKQIKVAETEKLLVFASSAMERGEFISAKSLVDQAEMTLALETKGEISFSYIFTTYWYDIILGFIVLVILFAIIIVLVKRFRLKSKLIHLKDEEKILLFLIKDIQNKCFKDNKISMDDYKVMMSSYEDRYNKLLEEQIKINYTLKYFRKTEKALNEEKRELTKILEKLQRNYFYDNAIESRTYYIKFRSLTERISEIEADLAGKEFKKEVKKFKYKGDKYD